jgi:hypothetical protein
LAYKQLLNEMTATSKTRKGAQRDGPRLRLRLTIAQGGRLHIRHWVEVVHGHWTVAYLMEVLPDMPPRVAEVRVFPTERVNSREMGTWSGDSRRVPMGGIRSGILGKVRTREALRALHQQLGDLVSEIADELPDAIAWNREKEPAPARGRPPVSEETLARTARYYVDAIRKGMNPLPYIAARLGGVPLTTVRGWVHRARHGRRQYLTAASKQGATGGLETRLVEQVIGPRNKHSRRPDPPSTPRR